MADIEHPADGGGTVTFTGSDPILRSHFASAPPWRSSDGGRGGAAAIWREAHREARTSRSISGSIYINPIIGAVLLSQAAGTIPAADPLPANFLPPPLAQRALPQAPVGSAAMTFVPFETKDGRFFNVTGAYPHLNDRALRHSTARPGATTSCGPSSRSTPSSSRRN
jgi:hypothetical protein